MKKALLICALSAMTGLVQAESLVGGPEKAFNEGIKTKLSLNLWAAGIDSKLKWKDQKTVFPDLNPAIYQAIGSPSFGDEAYLKTTDLLEQADVLFLGSAQIFFGKWSLATDITYVSLETENSQDISQDIGIPDPDGTLLTGTTLDASQDTLYGDLNVGYALTPEIEVFAGVRWIRVHSLIELTVDGQLNSNGNPVSLGTDAVRSESDWFDPQIGVRVNSDFNQDFYLTAQADIAGLAGVEYAFHGNAAVGYRLTEHFNTEFGYRLLKYYANDDEVRFTQLNHGFQVKLVAEF